MDNNLVSIIIPTYNAKKYISETLNSVRRQSHKNWECLVIDDGSTDASMDIILTYCQEDIRFKYFYQNNSGPSVARNYGLSIAKGDYIQFLDADDALMPEFLEILIKEYKKTASDIIYYSDLWLGKQENIYETTLLSRPASIQKDLKFKEMYRFFADSFIFIPACVLFPAKSLKNKIWDTSLQHSEDWDFYLSVLNESKYFFRFFPLKLVIYRNTLTGLSKNSLNIIKANYIILNKWIKGNTKDYIVKTSKNFAKNITARIANKVSKVILPPFIIKYLFATGIIYIVTSALLLKWFINHKIRLN